ncbi:hypothetical protein MMC07_004495 [Pseudocyphellaria aurata]|nr:hypothetical protein [Pseudocyphellaria aurata]
MPGQDDLVISFEISHEQQSFRLLELPPALLDLITSANPPSLSLKSGVVSDQNALSPASSHAVLCTNDQTFHVRQVQSSNSVYLVQPRKSFRQNEPQLAETAVEAVARCASTLELIPASTVGVSLRQILPMYNSPLGEPIAEVETVEGSGVNGVLSKQEALENVPLSPRQFNEAWAEICAFELDGQAWIPSAKSLRGVWSSIIAAATSKSVNLGGKFLIPDIADVVEEDGFPRALFDAVIERNRMDGEVLMTDWVILAKDKCVSWIGGLLLELQSSPDGVAESEFLAEWKNQLPELWRNHALLRSLKCIYSHPSKGRITFGISSEDRSGPAAVSNNNGKRPGKWHEKFKSTRR